MRVVGLVLSALALASCASLPSGGRNRVSFHSEPPGALATTSLGPSCTTPCALSISRLESFTVTFTLAGHQPETVDVRSIEPQNRSGLRTEVGGFGVRVGLSNDTGMQDHVGQFRREHTPNPVSVALRPAGAR
jgi:hypothetical protein